METFELIFVWEIDFLGCIFFNSREDDTFLGTVRVPYIRPLYSSTVNFLLSSIEVLIYLLDYVSYSTLRNCLTTSCAKIYYILILLLGLKTNILEIKSINCAGRSLKNALVCTPTCVILDYFNIDFATSDYKLLISY